MIQAIETKYNGYRFRSRLEARWAVFFDALPCTPWEWRYETEGYEMHGVRYLPDFELISAPSRNGYGEIGQSSMFVEIKAKVLSPNEWNKAVMFSAFLEHDIHILRGEVGLDTDIMWIGQMGSDLPEYLIGTNAIPPFMCGSEMRWGQCNHCRMADMWLFVDENEGNDCPYCRKGRFEEDTADLILAASAARSARFEHGETPRR